MFRSSDGRQQTFDVGDQIAHYVILKPLGRGGMGQVYLAHDERLSRDVALKVLPDELARDPRFQSRFQNEAEIAASLKHPNVVTIHSVESEDDLAYITMEFVDGEPLSEVLRRGPLPMHRLLALARTIVGAVKAAHDAGVVHRDIKPANVMVDRDGVPHLLDFGLARPVDRAVTAARQTSPSRPGGVAGTAGYMSPEQSGGLPVDRRADIFALGVLLHEMATGMLESRSDETLRRTSSPGLDRIIRRCVSRDPAARFDSAGDLLRALSRLAGRSGVATGAPRAWLLPLIAVVIIGLAAWFAIRLNRHPAAPPATDASEYSLLVVPVDARDSQEDSVVRGVASEVAAGLGRLPGMRVTTYRPSDRDHPGSAVLEPLAFASTIGARYMLEVSVEQVSPRLRMFVRLTDLVEDDVLWVHRFDRPADHLLEVKTSIVVDVSRNIDIALVTAAGAGGVPLAIPQRPPTSNLDAYHAYLRGLGAGSHATGHPFAAATLFERSIAFDPDFALAHAQLSQTLSYLYSNGYNTTEGLDERAFHHAEEALRLQDELPEGYLALGYYFLRCRHDYGAAHRYLDLAARHVVNDYELLHARGAVYRRMGRFDLALEQWLEASSLAPTDAHISYDLGETYQYTREYELAEEYFKRMIQLDPGSSSGYAGLSTTFLFHGRVAEALEFAEATPPVRSLWGSFERTRLDLCLRDYDAARARLEPLAFERESPGISARVRNTLGIVYRLLGRDDDARAVFDDLRRNLEPLLEADPSQGPLRLSLATAYAGLGRKEQALDEAERGVDWEAARSDAVIHQSMLVGLAQVYVMTGEHDKAIAVLTELLSMPARISVDTLRLEPYWDPLRNEPAFQELLRQPTSRDRGAATPTATTASR